MPLLMTRMPSAASSWSGAHLDKGDDGLVSGHKTGELQRCGSTPGSGPSAQASALPVRSEQAQHPGIHAEFARDTIGRYPSSGLHLIQPLGQQPRDLLRGEVAEWDVAAEQRADVAPSLASGAVEVASI